MMMMLMMLFIRFFQRYVVLGKKGKNFDPIEIVLMISLCYKYFSFKIYMLTEYMF